jgi:hypothetical protein
MTTTLARRAPQTVVEQRRATRRRLITWRRRRTQAHTGWCAAFNAIDNDNAASESLIAAVRSC